MVIISHLMGGLGNQMFQYSVARSLQLRSGAPGLRVFFEDGYRLAIRSYSLDAFNVAAAPATPLELNTVGPERRLKRRIKQMLKLPMEKNVVREKRNFTFDPSVLDRRSDTYLIGFWQAYRYFENIREQLLSDFQLRSMSAQVTSSQLMITSSSRSVSLHIRRDDYLKPASGFAPLPLHYYKTALQILKDKLGVFEVFVFTDDVPWAKNNLHELVDPALMKIISSPAFNDYEELILMSSCHHHIIANSSFSWWGAWLNDKPGKIVVAPRYWNGTDESIPTNDLIPNQWMLA